MKIIYFLIHFFILSSLKAQLTNFDPKIYQTLNQIYLSLENLNKYHQRMDLKFEKIYVNTYRTFIESFKLSRGLLGIDIEKKEILPEILKELVVIKRGLQNQAQQNTPSFVFDAIDSLLKEIEKTKEKLDFNLNKQLKNLQEEIKKSKKIINTKGGQFREKNIIEVEKKKFESLKNKTQLIEKFISNAKKWLEVKKNSIDKKTNEYPLSMNAATFFYDLIKEKEKKLNDINFFLNNYKKSKKTKEGQANFIENIQK